MMMRVPLQGSLAIVIVVAVIMVCDAVMCLTICRAAMLKRDVPSGEKPSQQRKQ